MCEVLCQFLRWKQKHCITFCIPKSIVSFLKSKTWSLNVIDNVTTWFFFCARTRVFRTTNNIKAETNQAKQKSFVLRHLYNLFLLFAALLMFYLIPFCLFIYHGGNIFDSIFFQSLFGCVIIEHMCFGTTFCSWVAFQHRFNNICCVQMCCHSHTQLRKGRCCPAGTGRCDRNDRSLSVCDVNECNLHAQIIVC